MRSWSKKGQIKNHVMCRAAGLRFKRAKPDLAAQMLAVVCALVSMFVVQTTTAQPDNSEIVPVISLLLENECVRDIEVGEVISGQLKRGCTSLGRESQGVAGVAARYFSFTHAGGPLFIELLSGFPQSYDTYLFLRQGKGDDGPLVADETPNGTIDDSGEDDDGADNNGADDGFGARIIKDDLAAGEYTIEATASLANTQGTFVLSVYGDVITASATGLLNDTGVIISGSADANSMFCDGTGNFDQQDCDFGRDGDQILSTSSAANNGDGVSGFSFLKVSASGAPLPAQATEWRCVKDNVTGLMWEVKTDNTPADLFDNSHTYSWYNPDNTLNGGSTGPANEGSCFAGVSCDTTGYVTAVNTATLCSFDDWRLPTMTELRSITLMRAPFIDLAFFPNLANRTVWSAEPSLASNDTAWYISYADAKDGFGGKGFKTPVRLVRAGAQQ